MYISGDMIMRERGLIAQAAGSSSVLLELLRTFRDARVRDLAVVSAIQQGGWAIRQPRLSTPRSVQEQAWVFKLLNLSRLTSGSVMLVKLSH